MADPALRAIAVAGVLAAGVLMSGWVAVPATAEPTDSEPTSQDAGDSERSPSAGAATLSKPAEVDDADDDGMLATDSVPRADSRVDDQGTAGNVDEGLIDLDEEAVEEEGGAVDPPSTARRDVGIVAAPDINDTKKSDYSNSLTLPVPRLPGVGEIPAGSWPKISSFYTTVSIPVPTFEELLAALRINPTPTPAPAPGPAFRTQEEEPVADATTGTAGGGGGGVMMSESTVMSAPLVTVPRATTVGGAGIKLPPAETAAVVQPGVTPPGAAGARTPVIRGSLPPSPEAARPTPAAAASLSGQRTRIGYPRTLSSPPLAEIAAVALPGAAGLLLITFGGGVIGYRQANSARFIRTAGAERFLA